MGTFLLLKMLLCRLIFQHRKYNVLLSNDVCSVYLSGDGEFLKSIVSETKYFFMLWDFTFTYLKLSSYDCR